MKGRAFFTQTKRFWYVLGVTLRWMVKRQYKSLKEGNKRWKTIIEGRTAVKEDASASLDFRARKEWEFLFPTAWVVQLSQVCAVTYWWSNSLRCLQFRGQRVCKDGIQGGLPRAVSLVRNSLIRQRAAVLPPSFVPFLSRTIEFLLCQSEHNGYLRLYST